MKLSTERLDRAYIMFCSAITQLVTVKDMISIQQLSIYVMSTD